MLGGFRCSRNSLIGLNIFYFVVGLFLIGLGTHLSTSNQISSLPIIGGVVACGVFLLMISVAGIFGAMKHHQVLLFFYMVILFVLFVIQFSIGCACLSVSDNSQQDFALKGWESVENDVKDQVQHNFKCCGFKDLSLNDSQPLGHPSCNKVMECIPNPDTCSRNDSCCTITENCGCPLCQERLTDVIARAFRVTGAVSLFFSFTEFMGIFVTVRYRNQKDPSGGNPSAFL